MEENRTIKRVGNYSTKQAKPEDCICCHNAKFATILVNDICLDCLEKKFQEKEIVARIRKMAIPSLEPDSFEMLEDIIGELCRARHIMLE